MTTGDPTTRDEARRAANPAARLFAVRLWKEELAGGSEYRGSVRDVAKERRTARSTVTEEDKEER